MKQLGVVIPTRNSAAWLPRHLDGLASWFDLADEIVVVDSQSTDGTLDILQARLADKPVRWLQHPPGLYASWNLGIANLNTRWTYIATVGDTINRAGLCALLKAIERLDCDVVCSPPRWVWPDGRSSEDATPVGEMAAELGLSKPARLMPAVVVAYCAKYALCRGLNTPLCSSASDLYRTETLQRLPFPVDYGSAGDAFWLLRHAPTIRYGLVPQPLAEFLAHPSQHAPMEAGAWARRHAEAAALCRAGVSDLVELQSVAGSEHQLLERLVNACQLASESEQEFERLRQGIWRQFWALRPRGWRARQLRNRLRRQADSAHAKFIGRVLADGKAVTKTA